jgi:hypothetical protein
MFAREADLLQYFVLEIEICPHHHPEFWHSSVELPNFRRQKILFNKRTSTK